MYRHLLVPLDDSPLSATSARRAVELARTLGAKVTFFHAQEDFATTSLGALQRVISPAVFNASVAGDARAILSKAEVIAREMGVPHESLSLTSNRPYEAILHAAEMKHCDLIFIASHGRRGIRGLMLGSQTHKVLQHSTVPVLVSAVETNVPAEELNAPLAIIADEHRSLAAVIHGLEFIAHEAREHGTAPSFPLLRAMLHYIRSFPERLHHPKEDAYLFRRLRERTQEFDATLDELERQHAEGTRLVDELERAIDRYQRDPAHWVGGFSRAVERFASMQMQHMRLETKVILPAARSHLRTEDWEEIGRAFADNGDPRFSWEHDEAYRQLFSRILNLAPKEVVGGG